MKQTLERIFAIIDKPRKNKNYVYFEDAFKTIRIIEKEDFDYAHLKNKELRIKTAKALQNKECSYTKLFPVYRMELLFDAPYDFDTFMTYIEIDRDPKDKFYAPRRDKIKTIVDDLQDLVDDKLDELFISCPPRIGKTSIIMFFLTWYMGRFHEKSNLYTAYSDTITTTLYNGIMEILNDQVTYLYHDVFPEIGIANQDAKQEILNLGRRKRYPSLTCRSLYGTLNGACDCNGILIADDLIGGIEEALNKDRLISAWSKVDNNLIPRAKENAKLIWIGTRWSIADPIGKRVDLLQSDEKFKNRRFKVVNCPALNDKDESNFDYKYNVGFSTEYYHQRRASFEKNNDMASWNAQYMGEPIEREGTLFQPDDFKYYNGTLPDVEPYRIFMPVDPAFGGGDFVAAPIFYQYGEDLYIPDVVFDNNDKSITQPLIVNKVVKYNVRDMQVEGTKTTASYKEGIEEKLKEKGYKCSIRLKAAPTNISKNQRIYDKAPEIREHIYFLEPSKRTKEYNLFMNNLFSFKLVGKNKNDDAPDSLAMGMDMFKYTIEKVKVFKRPF